MPLRAALPCPGRFNEGKARARGAALRSGALFLLAGLASLPASSAQACSGLPCWPGRVLPMGGRVPLNQLTLIWETPQRMIGVRDPVTPHLYLRTAGNRSELPLREAGSGLAVKLTPDVPVAAGSQLLFEWADDCSVRATRSAMFEVTDAAPLPNTLGKLQVLDEERGPVLVSVSTGECAAPVQGVYADLSVELSAEAVPYADVLRYGLVVDGSSGPSYGYNPGPYGSLPRVGATMQGPGRDRVFVLCGEHRGERLDMGLKAGVHRVQMVAWLPDDSKVVSDEIEVELRCEADGCALRPVSSRSAATFFATALALIASFAWRRRRR